jgi:UDP-N-acetylmuramyl pentapeptide phosphotransferase/UDP-N-acetylglucosamine-1-phosphate transferase
VSDQVVTFSVLAVLGASFAFCSLLILTQRWHGSLSLDHDLAGAQKIHSSPVPRVGGLGILASLLVGAAVEYAYGGTSWSQTVRLLACAAPVFAAGLIEDLTKRVSVKTRLTASFLSAGLAAWFLEAHLVRLDTPFVDALMTWMPMALLFTCFAVAGMTNAINILDGLNGLASGAVSLMLAGLATIAWQAGDMLVVKMCFWGIAAMCGFLALNYPFGRIFLGDGGAYLAGFWLAECAVLVLHRNPGVSTWAVLLCVAYPTWETLYSIYRRLVKQKVSSGLPDMVHLHHLVFKKATRVLGPQARSWLSHLAASGLVWIFIGLCQVGAVLGWNKHSAAGAMTLAFIAVYLGLYGYIVRQEHAEIEILPARLSTGQTCASIPDGFTP